MNSAKWIRWIIIQVLLGVLILYLNNNNNIASNTISALIFFYAGFSISTGIMVVYLLYSEKASNASQKGGRIWGGVVVKFILSLILIVAYLALGGFQTAEEGMVVILLYILYGWLNYKLAVAGN